VHDHDKSFEEVVESREMIQEKVNRHKYKIVDLVLSQKDLDAKRDKIESDVALLKERVAECLKS